MKYSIQGKRVRTFTFTLLGLAALVATGCAKPVGTVKGTIKRGGQPITSGRITFNVGNEQGSTTIQPDGTYEAVGVPVGNDKVTVESPKPGGGAPPIGPPGREQTVDPEPNIERAMEKIPKEFRKGVVDQKKKNEPAADTWQEIPTKYADASKTPLETEVKRGENTFDIKIEE